MVETKAKMTIAPLLTFREACEQLKLSGKTLRQLIARGEIKAGKVGGTWRIRQADIDAYFDQQCAAVPSLGHSSAKRGRLINAPQWAPLARDKPRPWEEVLARKAKR